MPRLSIRPGRFALTVHLTPAGAKRLVLIVAGLWVLFAIARLLATDASLSRWARPTAGQAIGLIVAGIWLSQLMPFLKRTARPPRPAGLAGTRLVLALYGGMPLSAASRQPRPRRRPLLKPVC